MEQSFAKFREKHEKDLDVFKAARDKILAHSEFFLRSDGVLPEVESMESLFGFAVDFYEVICHAFVRTMPDDLRANRPAQVDCERLLEDIGIKDIKRELL